MRTGVVMEEGPVAVSEEEGGEDGPVVVALGLLICNQSS